MLGERIEGPERVATENETVWTLVRRRVARIAGSELARNRDRAVNLDDIVQTVVHRILAASNRLEPRAWLASGQGGRLRGFVRRVLLEERRSAHRHALLEAPDEVQGCAPDPAAPPAPAAPSLAGLSPVHLRELASYVKLLRKSQRMVMQRVMRGDSHSLISAALKIPSAAVARRVQRSLERIAQLRAAVWELGGAEPDYRSSDEPLARGFLYG